MHTGFNPRARWDRHIPMVQDCDFDPREPNERIEVLAWFKNGGISPRIFIWNGKQYSIKKVTYNWQERRGKEVISCFSVDTNSGLYQISFNNTSLGWRINKIIE